MTVTIKKSIVFLTAGNAANVPRQLNTERKRVKTMKKATENQKQFTVFQKKREMLNVMERLFKILDDEEEDLKQSYEVIGKEEEQATNWKTGELLFVDEEKTIPLYRDKYGYIDRKESDYTDIDFAKLDAIKTIKQALEELI